jgi:hypothetical protein
MKTPGGNDITDRVDLMKYNLYPHGKNSRYIEKMAQPHNYMYLLPESLQRLFARTFDLDDNSVDISEWLNVLMDCINSGKVKENPFSKRPMPPIFILKNSLPESAIPGERVSLNWYLTPNTKLSINGQSVDPSITCQVVTVPDSLKIIVEYRNDKSACKQEYSFEQASCFCMNCGAEYVHPSDVFCYNCGVRK